MVQLICLQVTLYDRHRLLFYGHLKNIVYGKKIETFEELRASIRSFEEISLEHLQNACEDVLKRELCIDTNGHQFKDLV